MQTGNNNTDGKVVRGSRRLCTQNPIQELPVEGSSTCFSRNEWKHFRLPGLCKTYLTCLIKRNASHFYFEIHKLQNFRGNCSRGWNICVDYDLQGPIIPHGNINPYGDRKSQLKGIWLPFVSSFTMKITVNASSKYLSPPPCPQRAGNVTRNSRMPRNVTLLYGTETSKR